MNFVMNQSIHKLTCMIGDRISNAIKSNRQVNYKTKTKASDFRRRTEYQIQLSVGIAIHQSTRSKKVIDIMHVLGLSLDYNRSMRLETQLARSVLERNAEERLFFLHFCKEINFPFLQLIILI